MIYEYRCTECSHISTYNRRMAERNDPASCEECGGATRRVITGGQGFTNVYGGGDFPGYMCPVTDQWVDSRRKRKEIMKRHNLGEHSSADQVPHHSGYR